MHRGTPTALAMSLLLAIALTGACSDDSKPAPDHGTTPDANLLEGGNPAEAAVPDGPAREASPPDGRPREATTHDAPKVVDGAATAVCSTLVTHCGSSHYAAYFNPLTLSNCKSIMSCMTTYYTGSCATLFNSLVTCMGTISSPSVCNTQCLSWEMAMASGCTCPASCGVNCGADAGR